MFAFFNRSRRHVAVLAALAMLASVLVAAPAVAADDPPEPTYTATFDACDSAPASGYTDVSESHANAGDIDCIAYYGITQGTSATTYSPLMSVSREHMALFLTRLASKVGIEMTDTPDDAGFTDIGDLSEKSQLAINQLADLDITRGTSDTTFSPGDSVRRDHMALFLSKLMDKMEPITDGVDDFGYTPSDVGTDLESTTDVDESKEVGSPFTDLGSATKSAYDAITELYELGVASGISDTSYSPSALITRAAMAEFMAGVMAHSNLRPAGLSIQVSSGSGYAATATNLEVKVAVSVRDDNFAPVADQAVASFSGADALTRDGLCRNDATGDCSWSANDEPTDEDGNIIDDGLVAAGSTVTFYAWIGDDDTTTFDADDVDYVSASATATKAEASMSYTTSINENAADEDGEDEDTSPNTVDLDRVSNVTITVQLEDFDEKDVARAGIEVTVRIDLGGGAVINSNAAKLNTDANGQVTYSVEGPDDDDDTDDLHPGDDDPGNLGTDLTESLRLEKRDDVITFMSEGLESLNVKIFWSEENPVTTTAKGDAPAYVVPDDDEAAVTATVVYYDQYGNGIREGGTRQMARIIIDEATDNTDATKDDVNVSRNGSASRRVVVKDADLTVGEVITVTFSLNEPANENVEDLAAAATAGPVQVVRNAKDSDTGVMQVNLIEADNDLFLAEADGAADGVSDLLYSYDSGDTFVNSITSDGTAIGDRDDDHGQMMTMEEFEKALGSELEGERTAGTVEVVLYSPDGSSIFRVTLKAVTTG